MEEYVDLKLKERNTWLPAWDRDKYTMEWIRRLKEKRRIEEMEEMEKGDGVGGGDWLP